jgi:hypothetical protein
MRSSGRADRSSGHNCMHLPEVDVSPYMYDKYICVVGALRGAGFAIHSQVWWGASTLARRTAVPLRPHCNRKRRHFVMLSYLSIHLGLSQFCGEKRTRAVWIARSRCDPAFDPGRAALLGTRSIRRRESTLWKLGALGRSVSILETKADSTSKSWGNRLLVRSEYDTAAVFE